MNPEEKLAQLGLALYQPGPPAGNYVGAVRTANLVFVSGHGPRKPEGGLVTGKLGSDLSVDEGYEAARLVMLSCLSSLKAELGSLDRVQRVVKLLGMVNCTEDFGDHPKVINGASDLLVEVFGEAGRHARSAVGMQSLPGGMAVEVEMIVEVGDA
jgi:enamine deaminase RidA (YjgF/YER057c/UK114 family)